MLLIPWDRCRSSSKAIEVRNLREVSLEASLAVDTMRCVGAILALGLAGCAYGGTQVTHEMLSSIPLTQLVSGGDGVTRVAPGAIWHIWNDLNDPTSKLSVESKIRRAALNSSGYTCKDYNARGDHLTQGGGCGDEHRICMSAASWRRAHMHGQLCGARDGQTAA